MERTEKLRQKLNNNLSWDLEITYRDLRSVDKSVSTNRIIKVEENSDTTRKLETVVVNYYTYLIHYPHNALTLLEDTSPISIDSTIGEEGIIEIREEQIIGEEVCGVEVELVKNQALKNTGRVLAELLNRDVADVQRYLVSPYGRLTRLNPESFSVQSFSRSVSGDGDKYWFGDQTMTHIGEAEEANSVIDF